MIEIVGDFWQYTWENKPDAIVCTTNNVVKSNGELVMGAGIAKQFTQRFPSLPKIWGDLITRRKKYQDFHSTVFATHTDKLTINDFQYRGFVVFFQTKYDWRDNSSINLIEQSAFELAELTDVLDWKSVLMTRPGCGCGGLDWKVVKPIIQEQFEHTITNSIIKVITEK